MSEAEAGGEVHVLISLSLLQILRAINLKVKVIPVIPPVEN